MAETPSPLLDARESVFQLSSLANRLQAPVKNSPQVTGAPDYEPTAHLQPTARFLNHLSACLTRGEKTEANRVVAATIGPERSSRVSVSVVSCADKDEKGSVTLWTLPAETTSVRSALLDALIAGNAKTGITSSSFPQFVEEAMTLLRNAAACIKATPTEAPVIREAVCFYFVGHCEKKMWSRVRAIGDLYHMDLLKNWSPSPGEALPELHIDTGNDYLTRSLHNNDVPHVDSSFLFSVVTASTWWFIIISLVSALKSLLDLRPAAREDNHVAMLTGYSRSLHVILRKVPGAFWQSNSLASHLSKCLKARDGGESTSEGGASKSRMSGSREPHQAQDLKDRGGGETLADKEAAEEPQEVIEDAMPLGFPLPTGVPYGPALFVRAVDAICAWTTGPPILVNSAMQDASIPVEVSVVDLPRSPVHAYPPEEVTARWARIGQWKAPLQHSVLNALKQKAIEVTEGACHCEAGLMASIFLRDKTNVTPQGAEPACLEKAFKTMNAEDIKTQARFTVGVAKKCCPVCRMLGDVLQDTYMVKFDLPGRHSTYRPWVPPHWLPDAVTAELEVRLIEVVRRMVEAKEHLLGSRASSPGSDGGGPVSDNLSGLGNIPPIDKISLRKRAKFGVPEEVS
ncbi:hypothetical protein C8R47DRAFT_1103627 [Mycena vitilis]|nr:hypothetical protein C8R47DRAFT_1103627 [Mycena vitilis]